MKVLQSISAMLLVGIFLVACGGTPEDKTTKVASSSTESEVSTSDQPDDQIVVAKKLIASTDASKVKAVDAKKMFKNYCALCHGRKGDMTINGAKKLSKTKTTIEQRVAQIYFGKGTMTPFKGMIKDEEIIAVANYIDELKK